MCTADKVSRCNNFRPNVVKTYMQKCKTPPGYDPPEIPPVKSASKVETLFQHHTPEIRVLLFSMGPPPAEINVQAL